MVLLQIATVCRPERRGSLSLSLITHMGQTLFLKLQQCWALATGIKPTTFPRASGRDGSDVVCRTAQVHGHSL